MRCLGICGVLFCCPAAVWAAPVTVSLPASKDNTLYEDANGTLSDGVGPHLFAGRTAQSPGASIRRGLIAFNLSSIPAGATIVQVTLTLNVSKTASPTATNVELHRVSRNWGEGTSNSGDPGGSGAFSTPNDATWKHAIYSSVNWTNPGGDFVSGASAVSSRSGTGSETWSGAGMVADVQGWVGNSATNFGWELIGNESIPVTSYRFDTRENFDPAVQPALSVTYNVPEPVGLALAALLLPMMARRRSRGGR
jgi:hypothetical protein